MSINKVPSRQLMRSELSGAFVVADPNWRKKICFGGILLLLIHPIGWPAALGYRKELISRLFSGQEPILPEWRSKVFHYFFEGLKAMGVIFGYISPLYITLLIFLLINGVQPDQSWLYVVVFFFVFTIFSTLSFLAAVVYWAFFSQDYQMPMGIAVVLLVAFAGIIFFIPAAFLQVSKSGRYLSAFNMRSAFHTLCHNFKAYSLAWYHSALMSLVGHFALPFAPFGVFWCYLGIIFEFNSILHSNAEIDSSSSWFSRFRDTRKLLVEPTKFSRIYFCPSASDVEPCLLMKLGPIVVPLPAIISKYLIEKET